MKEVLKNNTDSELGIMHYELFFPQSTLFDRRIPKQKFYDNLSIPSALKRSFTDDVEEIVWKNKLSAATMNIAEGQTVKEIEILEVRLKKRVYDKKILIQIDRGIPYHILFVLVYGGEAKLCVGYKEQSGNNQTAFGTPVYYETDWQPEDEITLALDGLNMDAVYESFVRQIAGGVLAVPAEGQSEKTGMLAGDVAREEKRKELQKQIDALEKRIACENQFNRQMELWDEVKRIREMLNSECGSRKLKRERTI
jgi:hypothetical protein